MSGEKTQQPTQRRLEQAVKDGNLFQPKELPAAVALAVLALLAMGGGALLWQGLAAFLADSLGGEGWPGFMGLLASLPWGWALLPAALALAATIAALATTRHVSLNQLAPKFNRLSPVAGLQRLVSLTNLANAGLALAKLGLFAALALFMLWPQRGALAGLTGLEGLGPLLLRLLAAVALAMAAVALVDAGVTWVLRRRKLMMTLEEVKRESRESEGAPELKAAIKRAQMAAASRRMGKTMADAGVVLVNPTHFAVALRYRPGQDAAPVVVEKGREDMALAVISVARARGIPIIRTPRLARALFWSARRGEQVREELFQAVATILAFIMRFDDAAAVPDVFVPPEFDFDETGARRKPGAPLAL